MLEDLVQQTERHLETVEQTKISSDEAELTSECHSWKNEWFFRQFERLLEQKIEHLKLINFQ